MTPIETVRLSLRPLAASDSNVILEHNTGAVAQYFHTFSSLNEVKGWVKQALTEVEAGKKIELIITNKERGDFIGLISLRDLDTPNPEFGLWITERQQANGYAKEAMLYLIQWAAENTQAKALMYDTEQDNFASNALAESLGMTKREVHTIDGVPFCLYQVKLVH